jgi:hypothetical protein
MKNLKVIDRYPFIGSIKKKMKKEFIPTRKSALVLSNIQVLPGFLTCEEESRILRI